MTSDYKNAQHERGPRPTFGVCLWLLRHRSLAAGVAWAADRGFTGVSLLQCVLDLDPGEQAEAAAEIRARDLRLTYHGNVHHRTGPNGLVDEIFREQVLENVLHWHESAGGVYSCCSDAIKPAAESDAARALALEENLRHARRIDERLAPAGIRIGIENAFLPGHYSSIAEFRRFRELCAERETGMLLDAGHANIRLRAYGDPEAADMSGFVAAIPFDIHETHLSGNCGADDEHRELAYGNLDLDGLCLGLARRGFAGQLSLEICADIAAGRYALDVSDPGQTELLTGSLALVSDAWERAAKTCNS